LKYAPYSQGESDHVQRPDQRVVCVMQFAVAKFLLPATTLHGRLMLPPGPAKTVCFLSFPYVCPEPVLVKRAFFDINGF